jgi:hypothetical protein
MGELSEFLSIFTYKITWILLGIVSIPIFFIVNFILFHSQIMQFISEMFTILINIGSNLMPVVSDSFVSIEIRAVILTFFLTISFGTCFICCGTRFMRY